MTDTPLLQLQNITKTFGSVQALDDVDFEVRAGEVMALVGDNGAGKSTLVKCVAGTHTADSGRIQFEGQEVQHPRAEGRRPARDRGRLPGSRALRQPRRRPEHVPRPRAQSRADPLRGADGAAHRRDTQVSGGHDDQVDSPDSRDAVGRAASVGRRRPRGDVELEARHPRRADRRARRRADRAGARARAPSRQPGPRSDAHLPQPPRRLRDRRPDHACSVSGETSACSSAARRHSRRSSRRSPQACPRRSPGSRPQRAREPPSDLGRRRRP